MRALVRGGGHRLALVVPRTVDWRRVQWTRLSAPWSNGLAAATAMRSTPCWQSTWIGLYATATLVLHDRALAEDAVQEALIRAWRDTARDCATRRASAAPGCDASSFAACCDEERAGGAGPCCVRPRAARARHRRGSRSSTMLERERPGPRPSDGSRVEAPNVDQCCATSWTSPCPDVADAMRVPARVGEIRRPPRRARAARRALEADDATGCRRPRECLVDDRFPRHAQRLARLAGTCICPGPHPRRSRGAGRRPGAAPDGPVASVGGGRCRHPVCRIDRCAGHRGPYPDREPCADPVV